MKLKLKTYEELISIGYHPHLESGGLIKENIIINSNMRALLGTSVIVACSHSHSQYQYRDAMGWYWNKDAFKMSTQRKLPSWF